MLKSYLYALIMFSVVILAFTVIPNEKAGFWERNDYNMGANDLQSLNQTDSVANTIVTISCDVNPEAESCQDIERTSLIGAASNIVQGIVKGGFGALISIYKSLGIAKVMIEGISLYFGVPPFITNAIISMLFVSIVITIILIIFNRSDL